MVEGVLLAGLLVFEGRSPVKNASMLPPRPAAPGSYVFAQTQRVDVGGGATKVSAGTNVPTPRRR